MVAAVAAVLILLLGVSIWWRARTPSVSIPLTAERAKSFVPRIKLPPPGTRLRVELRLPAPEPSASGTARFVFRTGERSYPATIRGSAAVLELDRNEIRAEPCQIDLTTSSGLIASGNIVFTD